MLLFWSRFMRYYWLLRWSILVVFFIRSLNDCLISDNELADCSRSHFSQIYGGTRALGIVLLLLVYWWPMATVQALCTILLRVEFSRTLPTYIYDICINVHWHIAFRLFFLLFYHLQLKQIHFILFFALF